MERGKRQERGGGSYVTTTTVPSRAIFLKKVGKLSIINIYNPHTLEGTERQDLRLQLQRAMYTCIQQ